jgi:flagellar biogenesis protein FliO
LGKRNRVLVAVFLLVAAGLFLLPAVTLGKPENDPGSNFNSSGQWIWALLSLVIVVALSYWVTKFFAGKFGISQARHIKVAESLSLGPNRHLYLLLVNEKVLLIGGSEHGLSLVKEIDDPGFFAELEKTAHLNQTPTGKFSGMLGPILNGLNPRGAIDVSAPNSRQRLQEGLEKIRAWKMKGRGRE